MYSRMGEKEDDKVVELWRKDADGILIFVRPRVVFIPAKPVNWKF